MAVTQSKEIKIPFNLSDKKENQTIFQVGTGQILWRNSIYEKKIDMMDTELIVDIYERGRERQESKIQKMRIALWILGVSMFTMANILLFLLI